VSSSTHPDEAEWSSQPDAAVAFSVDDTAPIDGYSWAVDRSPSTTPDTISEGAATSATVTPGEGASWFHVRARNSAGSWGPVRHYALKTDAVTGSAAISSSSHPSPESWYNSRRAVLAWSASEESGIAGYSTSITPDSPGNPGTTVSTTGTSFETDLAEDRVWYLNIRVENRAGLWGPTASYRLKVDTTVPPAPTASSSTHVSPTAWYSNNDPSFTFGAGDSLSGVGGFSYVLDQSAATVPDQVSEGIAGTKSYTDVSDGIHWFHVRARDGAGNWGPALHVQVRVDSIAPSAQSVTDAPDPVNVNSTVTFGVAWSDDPGASPVRAVVCKTNAIANATCPGGTWATGGLGTSSPRSATSSTITSGQGNYGYWGFACDAAGNCSTPKTGSFHVNGLPTLTSTEADPLEVIAGETVVFRAKWTDSGDLARAVVCKSASLADAACREGYWARSPFSSDGASAVANPTSESDLGQQSYWFWVCDDGGLCAGPQTGTFTVQPNAASPHTADGDNDSPEKGPGTEAYTHPCDDGVYSLINEDDHQRYFFGAPWEFRHNTLSYPANGYIHGTESLSPDAQRELIRAAVNAGPGGANTFRTQDECRDQGKVPGESWTKFADAGAFTEDPARRDGVNGFAFIDFRNPPPTTVRNCRNHMIEWAAIDIAVMCPVSVDTSPDGRNWLREWAILFNVHYRQHWTVNVTGAPENELIVQAVATHEILHAAGVQHALASDRRDNQYCTRAEPHAALTMYPCYPVHRLEGGFMIGGRANFWPYTLGWGDMNGLWDARD
jgi:hypothetical protein